ncbi:MAG: ABC-type transport auxiliary lipoprotein family protein [Deltaproteobacteria bacterium]|jgi:ABC-type uncharacterized transport system auxiliary subunit|nr:ABC-type transport auxiliary lipoprotein family protein [Deltaproteobacteria bacterium]
MKNPLPSALKTAFCLLAALQAGCGDLLLDHPPHIIILREYASEAPLCAAPLREQLVVDMPEVYAGLDTDRIAMLLEERELQYLSDYRWDTPVPLLVQRGLVNALNGSGCFAGAGTGGYGLSAPYRLLAQIKRLHFLHGREGVSFTAQFQLALTLVDAGQGRIAGQRAFSALREGLPADPYSLGAAMEEILQQALREAVEWIRNSLEEKKTGERAPS